MEGKTLARIGAAAFAGIAITAAAIEMTREERPVVPVSRVHGNVLIVDRLFGAAELRLGKGDRQQTVRILRTDGRPSS